MKLLVERPHGQTQNTMGIYIMITAVQKDNTYETLAKEFGVDPISLKSLTEYLTRHIRENDELRLMFFQNPDLVLELGVNAWRKASEKFFNDILNNDERFQAFCAEMYDELRSS